MKTIQPSTGGLSRTPPNMISVRVSWLHRLKELNSNQALLTNRFRSAWEWNLTNDYFKNLPKVERSSLSPWSEVSDKSLSISFDKCLPKTITQDADPEEQQDLEYIIG